MNNQIIADNLGVTILYQPFSLDDDADDQKASPPAPRRGRTWTGRPKGKTPEQQQANIRKRKSYAWLLSIARNFREKGILPEHIPHILEYIVTLYSDKRMFPYRSRGFYQKQSLEVIISDIKDANKLEELGL